MSNPSWARRIARKYGAPKSKRRLVAACVGIFLLSGSISYVAQQGFRQYTGNPILVSAIFGFLGIIGVLLSKRGLWMLASVFLGILSGSILLIL